MKQKLVKTEIEKLERAGLFQRVLTEEERLRLEYVFQTLGEKEIKRYAEVRRLEVVLNENNFLIHRTSPLYEYDFHCGDIASTIKKFKSGSLDKVFTLKHDKDGRVESIDLRNIQRKNGVFAFVLKAKTDSLMPHMVKIRSFGLQRNSDIYLAEETAFRFQYRRGGIYGGLYPGAFVGDFSRYFQDIKILDANSQGARFELTSENTTERYKWDFVNEPKLQKLVNKKNQISEMPECGIVP